MSECPLCHGTGVFHHCTASTVTASPCPNCNEVLKERRKREFEELRNEAKRLEKFINQYQVLYGVCHSVDDTLKIVSEKND